MAGNGDSRIFAGDEMTSRQRLLAAYRGQAVDRLPFWPKVPNPTWRTSQPPRVAELSDRQLLDRIGADGLFGGPRGIAVHRPRVEVESTVVDETRTVRTRTPDGDLQAVWKLDPYTQSWHPIEFPIKTPEDIARYRWVYTDVRIEPDDEQIQAGRTRRDAIGERGLMKTAWGTTPLMELVEHIIGPVETHLMLFDHAERLGELIEQMHATNVRIASAVAEHTAADIVVSVENTSTTMISPAQFRRYCKPHLEQVGQAIEAAGKIHELHQCGQLYDLLADIDTIPASSIEAFTAPTLGNTRLVDGRKRAPSKTLVGGTRVNTWLMPLEAIKEYIYQELQACPDHRRIVLTTAGVAPPACSMETFAAVAEWLAAIPVRC